MKPSVYLFRVKSQHYELYLGECSTLDGLSCFDPGCEAQITSFGATNYQEYNWATEQDIPSLKDVASIIVFLQTENDIDLAEFEATIKNIGSFSTHDDDECNFRIKQRGHFISVLKKAVPMTSYFDLILKNLLEHPDCYLTLDEFGKIKIYETFDQYLARKT